VAIIYRFFNLKHGLRTLQSQKLKVGRILELNDPMDCRPAFVNAPVGVSEADQADEIKRRLDKFNEQVGVLCFSGTVSDPVLWSHYADHHRGIALGFEPMAGFKVFPVDYPKENKRPQLQYSELAKIDLNAPHDVLEDVFKRGFAVKANSWKYEDEARGFVYLGGTCKLDGEKYFLSNPHLWLSRVVLGVKCSISANDIKQSGIEKWPRTGDIKVLRAKPREDSFELDFE